MSGNARGARMFSKYLSTTEVAASHVPLGGAYFGNTLARRGTYIGNDALHGVTLLLSTHFDPQQLESKFECSLFFHVLSFALSIALFILESLTLATCPSVLLLLQKVSLHN